MAEAVLQEPDASTRRHALLRHDGKIASAALAAIIRKPLDLLTVLIAVPAALFALRAWTAGQSERLVALQAFAVGFAVAFYGVKALIHRCVFHRTDGILAADAQRLRELVAFAVPLFIAAAVLGFAYLLAVNAQRSALWLAATALGAVAAVAWVKIVSMLREKQPIVSGWLRPLTCRPGRARAVLVAGGAVLGAGCSILPLRLPAIAIAATAVAVIASMVLGRVDASAIRYRTMVGHGSWTIVRSHLSPLLSFFGPFAAALTLAPHWGLPFAAVVLGLAVAVFVAMRVLAYQSFHQRIADWFVSGLIAVAAMSGLALPPAAPAVMLVGIAWLDRRAASQRWLIA